MCSSVTPVTSGGGVITANKAAEQLQLTCGLVFRTSHEFVWTLCFSSVCDDCNFCAWYCLPMQSGFAISAPTQRPSDVLFCKSFSVRMIYSGSFINPPTALPKISLSVCKENEMQARRRVGRGRQGNCRENYKKGSRCVDGRVRLVMWKGGISSGLMEMPVKVPR